MRPGAAHCNLELPVEARRCTLQSGAPCSGLAHPGTTRCNLELPIGSWRCPLRSAPCNIQLAKKMDEMTAQRSRTQIRKRRRRKKKTRTRTTHIKSKNPHLTTGEKKCKISCNSYLPKLPHIRYLIYIISARSYFLVNRSLTIIFKKSEIKFPKFL